MLRTLLFHLRFIPATVFYSAATIALRNSPKVTWAERRWAASAVAAAGLDIRADLSAMDPVAPCVIMANHQSNLDIPVLLSLFPERHIGFVAKQSLFDIPLFGRAMLSAGHVPIDRSNRRKAMKSMDNAAKAAARGITVVIFPEGTRGRDLSRLQEFKIGGVIMALKCGLPVVPLIISGTGSVLPKGSARLRPGKVEVRALKPLLPENYTIKDRERFRDDLHTAMDATYQEISRA